MSGDSLFRDGFEFALGALGAYFVLGGVLILSVILFFLIWLIASTIWKKFKYRNETPIERMNRTTREARLRNLR